MIFYELATQVHLLESFIQFIPAGVRIPDETSMDGLISDASDISKDRILYRASFPVHNRPEQFLYRVE